MRSSGPADEPETAGAPEVPPHTGSADPEPRPRRRGYWIPGLIALGVLLAIGLALGAGDLDHRAMSTLPGTEVAQEIAIAMQAENGSDAPPAITCPASEPVRAAWHFECSMTEGEAHRIVQVDEIDGRGHLRWRLGS